MIRFSLLLSLCIIGTLQLGCRGGRSKEPPVHLNPNMDNQDKYRPYRASTFFADGKAMQAPPKGTIPAGHLDQNSPDWKVNVHGRKVASADVFYTGKKEGHFVNAVPYQLNEDDLERGRNRYAIYCTPCHGMSGYGNGTVAERARGKLKPTNFHDTPGDCQPNAALRAQLAALRASAPKTNAEPNAETLEANEEAAPREGAMEAVESSAGDDQSAEIAALEAKINDPYSGCAEGYVCVANDRELPSNPALQEGQCQRSLGYTYHVITNGVRSMKGYRHQLTDSSDRWAVAAYVRALELSQNADRNRVVDTFSDQLVAPQVQTELFNQLDKGGAYKLSKTQQLLPQNPEKK